MYRLLPICLPYNYIAEHREFMLKHIIYLAFKPHHVAICCDNSKAVVIVRIKTTPNGKLSATGSWVYKKRRRN